MDKKKSSKHKRPKGESIWREKYESLDEKYTRMKDILKQVLQSLKEETEKLQLIKKENSNLKEKLNEKESILERMQSVSEAVVDEYSILKAKYEMESEAATAAAKRATKYLQQNIILKRKSAVPPHNSIDFIQVDIPESLVDEDELEEINQNAEIELLSRTTSDLRNEVANLKIQLDKEVGIQASLKEDIEIAKSLFEEEMLAHNETKTKLKLAEKSLEHLKRLSEPYVVKESEDLHSNYQEESDKAKCISHEISAEGNNVLSEQHSALISNSSPSDQLSTALENIKELTAKIDDETKRHQQEIEELQNMLKGYQGSNSLKSTEDKLQCVELCLEQAEQRAYASERQVETLKHRVQELECQIQRLNAGLPLPPPPPPPPPPPSFNPLKSLITLLSSAKKASTVSALKKEVGDNQQQKAMSEMISAIKKGNVHLRPAPKGSGTNYEKAPEKSAVGEMKDMLISLKKQKLDTIGSPPLSVSPKPSSNELLEKLEKWHKISSFPDQLCDSKKLIPKEEEENSLLKDLQQVLENESLEGEVSENACSSASEDFIDMVSSPDSHAEEIASAHTSESEDAEYALLRKHPQTYDLGAEFILENADISRSTFVIYSASQKSLMLSKISTATGDANSVNKIPVDASSPSHDSCNQGNYRSLTCVKIQMNDNQHEVPRDKNSLNTAGESALIGNICFDPDCSARLRNNVANADAPLTSELNTYSENLDEQVNVSEEIPEIITDKVKLHDNPIPCTIASLEKTDIGDIAECETVASKTGNSNVDSALTSDC